jgi:hypothetical protein
MIEVTYVNHMGDDLSVVNAARVSLVRSQTTCHVYTWVSQRYCSTRMID